MIRAKHLKLVKKIFDYCAKYNLKISVAESCTGGLLATYFTYLPGSSEFFDRAIVSYSSNAKIDLFNISKEILESYNAVSFEVAILMARNLNSNKDNYLSIATTGLLGPNDDGSGKPIGLVYIAVNIGNEYLRVRELMLSGNRHDIQDQVIDRTLNLVIESLAYAKE